jgi:hypothetical protein
VPEPDPKITGKVDESYFLAPPKTGYLYIAVHVHIANSGGSTLIQSFRATFLFYGEVFVPETVPCAEFRLIKKVGDKEVSSELVPDMRLDKTPFKKQYPRDGWLCFGKNDFLMTTVTEEFYDKVKDFKVDVVDGADGVHHLESYPSFQGWRGRREFGKKLERIGPVP